MKELIPITVFSMVMVLLSHHYSGYDPVDCKYQRKERLFYTMMSIGLILFAGLRTGYNDTGTYLYGYNTLLKNPNWYDNIEWLKIGGNPGFIFVQGVMTELNVSPQSFLMFFSAFTVGVNLWFFRKYSCNLWLSVLLFITFAGYIFNLAAIKQCTAMAFCLIATDRAIHKKYIRFVLYVILGCLFHPYALMYLVVPFLFFRPWSKNTVFMLIIFAGLGFGMQFLVGTLLNVTDMLGENYNAASFVGEGVNPIRLLVTAVPAVLALMTSEQIARNEERDQYLIVNLTMLNAEIMFVALFGTANYFARLANYFIPFQALSLPWLLKHYDQEGRKTMTLLAVTGYVLFFIYSQSIHESFDVHYYSITFWEYLRSLFQGVF
jgi:hypothetical protein